MACVVHCIFCILDTGCMCWGCRSCWREERKGLSGNNNVQSNIRLALELKLEAWWDISQRNVCIFYFLFVDTHALTVLFENNVIYNLHTQHITCSPYAVVHMVSVSGSGSGSGRERVDSQGGKWMCVPQLHASEFIHSSSVFCVPHVHVHVQCIFHIVHVSVWMVCVFCVVLASSPFSIPY